MTIGRPQMEKQIRGYQPGGSVEKEEDVFASSGVDLSTIDAQTAMLLKALQAPSFEESQQKYQTRLGALYEPARRPNVYDLATQLSSSILSRPQDEGVFVGLGMGFNAFNQQVKKAQDEERKQRRALALKAAELAMEDERSAEKMLREYAFDILKSKAITGEPKIITLEYDEQDENGQFTGKKTRGSFDAVTQGPLIRKIITTQNGIKTVDIPDAAGETELDKLGAKEFFKAHNEIQASAATATGTLDTINEAKRLAGGIDPEDFGALEAATLGLRNFVSGFMPKGFIDTEKLGTQQALAQITIAFTLANVAQTKGAISNREMDLFKEASPFLGQTYEGFMLALDLQERIARKKIEFAREYNLHRSQFVRENPEKKGFALNDEMARWVDEWQASNRSRFLTETDLDNIARFKKAGEGLDLGDFSDYESRYNNLVRQAENKRVREIEDFTSDPELQSQNELMQEILSDPNLTPEEQTQLIQDLLNK
jgi:hypothetical protein